MPHYRAYLLDAADRILAGLDLDCETDAAAIDEASRLYGEHAIELWQGTRKVGQLRPATSGRLSDAVVRKRFSHLPWSSRQ